MKREKRKEEEEVANNSKLLRSRLENEQKRLFEELEQFKASTYLTEGSREGSHFGKREEEATESFELERRLALEKQMKEQLADVEGALRKFDEGKYGLCEGCGSLIDPARLEVLPQAKLCFDCKTVQAKSAKGRPSPG